MGIKAIKQPQEVWCWLQIFKGGNLPEWDGGAGEGRGYSRGVKQ